jgi:hypothetical protein
VAPVELGEDAVGLLLRPVGIGLNAERFGNLELLMEEHVREIFLAALLLPFGEFFAHAITLLLDD